MALVLQFVAPQDKGKLAQGRTRRNPSAYALLTGCGLCPRAPQGLWGAFEDEPQRMSL